ncbi:putative phage head-tail adaptor [Pseudoramibacter alactolyticus ATCC 23263]|uniref:Putative phage head-tail adaptor n=1 Tax=Pseudoramibacter alactolyticus ATCC 23263 TaxID=887929 RepID=E6MGX9_9FIRM|nr:phage head closure protein [Pseudoramibacter alactolyticus]EFV01869.1 putative phage head-tail adaptor [Pseudoramibacter alactolyticus ATCC 23263]
MDRSSVVTLVGKTHERDANGVLRAKTTEREVFCEITSVTGNEWFEGGRNGLNPSYRLILFAPDYRDEETVKIEGVAYKVYRTYRTKNDNIELYVERRKGA